MADDDDSFVSLPEPHHFTVLEMKAFRVAARRGMISWNPHLDLLAVVTVRQDVMLYRINGQRVWGFRGDPSNNNNPIETMRWRPDGKMLALGYADGTIRIHDVGHGKPMHRIVSETPGFGAVSVLGWADNYSHEMSPTQPPPLRSNECTPEAIFDLDIASMLPKLSTLPSSAGPESLFTSKSTLDALVNSITKGSQGSLLEVLLIGDDSGKILLNVFETFRIGTMELSKLSHQLKPGSKLVCHSTTTNLATHSLLTAEPGTQALQHSVMDILFMHHFGQYLFQLASISTRVHSMLAYVRETVSAIEAEFRTMNDVSQKYIATAGEQLDKKGDELGIEFFEFLVTGIPTKTLKEWLVGSLGERGQKRWEKSSMDGYGTLRRLVHEHLLPTCERLAVLFSRLRGLARWKESGSPLGLEPDDFTRCLDTVSGLLLHAHDFILKVNAELELFTCFCTWIRTTLDELASIVNIDDKNKEDPQIDTLKVAEYIGEHLQKSKLEPFLARENSTKLREYKETGGSIFELYSKKDSSETAPGFMELSTYLDELSKSVFAKPQQAMRQQIRVGKPLLLTNGPVSKMDMKTMSVDEHRPVTYIAMYEVDKPGNYFTLVRCELSVKGGISSLEGVGCANLNITDKEVLDFAIADQRILTMILRSPASGEAEVVCIDYPALEYDENYERGNDPAVGAYSSKLPAQTIMPLKRNFYSTALSSYPGFSPVQLTVNGIEPRRVGCVVDVNGLNYVVFDLDNSQEDIDVGAEQTMEVDE